ncbi:MAG: sulfite exporter TauE/SafE family protein, partial [Alphaproteobacteria bacterium]|nr:sulfite exporter TauE/SafE family protein [Alphaproteobacteria bacterium]MBT7942575.1 sulfite exporter TauE/SafE family protein [Alphaproteobacteria bacterium]
KVLVTGDTTTLTGLLGMLLCVYAVTGLSRFRIPPPGRAEPWLSPVMGGISGILTGLTGTFVVPGVLYLQSMGLNRNSLIQAMGMLFTVSTVALAVVLGHHKLMSVELGVYSLGGVVPALVGMVVGQRVRNRLSEAVFAKIFFASLLVLGAYIAARAFS